MNREEAEKDMHRLLNEAARKATDRNVEMLKVANKALQPQGLLPREHRPTPSTLSEGSTAAPDQTPVDIVRRAMIDARRIVDNFEKSTIELESKVAQLEAQLDAERETRQSLERMLTEITELVAPR